MGHFNPIFYFMLTTRFLHLISLVSNMLIAFLIGKSPIPQHGILSELTDWSFFHFPSLNVLIYVDIPLNLQRGPRYSALFSSLHPLLINNEIFKENSSVRSVVIVLIHDFS